MLLFHSIGSLERGESQLNGSAPAVYCEPSNETLAIELVSLAWN